MEELNKTSDNTGEPHIVVSPVVKEGGLRFNFDKHFLPLSILISAVLISVSVLYANGKIGSKGGTLAAVGGGQGDAGAPANIVLGPNDHVLGQKNAPVTIVEFADFRCPFCERFFTDAESQLVKEYVNTGKVKFVFKNYAFLGQQSTWASEAAECAAEQGKFWEYHDWLYTNQASESDLAFYSKANLIKYAGTVGLNTPQFSSCLNSDKYAEKVANDMSEGQKYGVSGTPTAFINGQRVVGAQPYATFKQSIETALKKK